MTKAIKKNGVTSFMNFPFNPSARMQVHYCESLNGFWSLTVFWRPERGVIISSECFKTNRREGILKRPSPQQTAKLKCLSVNHPPARARLLTLWETVIPRSPVDFKLMTFCFLYFQHRRSANLSFPGKCFLGSFPLRIQSDFFFYSISI